MLRREAAEDVDGVLFFGLLRAAGEEDDVVVGDAGQLAERCGARVVAVGLCAVVLQRAGDVDSFGGAPSARKRSADSSFWAAMRSICRSTRATSGRMRR